MLLTLFGIVMLFKKQLVNALFPISFTPSAIVTSERAESANALSPIRSTLAGMEIVFSVQLF